MNSEPLKKLKEEIPRPEWVFKVHKKPAGLTIEHLGDIHQLAEAELEDLMRGYLQGEYYMDVIRDEGWEAAPEEEKVKHEVHVLTIINLGRYDWIPKYLYRRFLMNVCDALGLIYRPFMLEAVYPRALTPKALVEFRPKPFWYKFEKRAEELKERSKVVGSDIKDLEELAKLLKEEKKK